MSKDITPGPWEFNYNGGEAPTVIYAGELTDETFVAELCQGLPPMETWANARLIAAAPELLAALKAARDFIQGCSCSSENAVCEVVEQCDEHIRKAEGRE